MMAFTTSLAIFRPSSQKAPTKANAMAKTHSRAVSGTVRVIVSMKGAGATRASSRATARPQ